jgi:nuclear distribution protein NudE
MIPPARPPSGASSASSRYSLESTKALPQLPVLHSNVTVRPPSKLPSGTASVLAQSRIGRPSSGGLSGRKSGDNNKGLDVKPELRPRSGSSASTYGI